MPSEPPILAALVYIQTHFDGDLSLGAVSRRAELSPSHFHRLFRAEVGETLKGYTDRLRLERAALHLGLHETTVLETALEVGFRHHETFTRAFRRHFGVPPQKIRDEGLAALGSRAAAPGGGEIDLGSGYQLSKIALATLKPLHLAFIRHLGPYESVDDSIWRELTSWADDEGLATPRVLLGIGHDAPGVTPPDKLRYDAAVRVEGPIRGRGDVGYQRFAGGRFAVATHVGHYSTLAAAYRELVGRIEAIRSVRFAGLPAVEFYHETTIDSGSSLNHTDLYLPVVSASSRAALVAP